MNKKFPITPLIYYLIAQGQGHFTSLQDLNTCNHLFDIILKEKQTTNVSLAHWNIIIAIK